MSRIASRSASAALLAIFAATAAPAQETLGTDGLTEIDDDLLVPGFDMTADEMEDLDVYGASGEQVGEVEAVLVDASGAPVAFAIETEGFLGIGDEDVVLPIDQARLAEGRLVTVLTEEDLEALPQWDD